MDIDGNLLLNAAKSAVLRTVPAAVRFGNFDDVVARTVLELLELHVKGYHFGPRVFRWAVLKALDKEIGPLDVPLVHEVQAPERPTAELALLRAALARATFTPPEVAWLRAKLEGRPLGDFGFERHVVSNAGRRVRRKLGEL